MSWLKKYGIALALWGVFFFILLPLVFSNFASEHIEAFVGIIFAWLCLTVFVSGWVLWMKGRSLLYLLWFLVPGIGFLVGPIIIVRLEDRGRHGLR